MSAVEQVPEAPTAIETKGGGASAEPALGESESAPLDALDLSRAFHGYTRSLFSARNGWLPFAPVGLLGVAAALALAARRRWWIAAGVGVAAVYFLQIALTGVLPGYAPPGRFELVFLPLVAVPLLLVLRDVAWTRAVFWPLVALGAVITLFGVDHARGLQPHAAGTAKADLGAATGLLRLWPDVSREPDRPPRTIKLDACEGRRPVGDLFGCGVNGSVRATPEMGAGYLYRGNAQRLPEGDWVVVASLMRDGPPDGRGARVEVRSNGTEFLEFDVPAAEIPVGELRAFTREISVPGDARIETRIHTYGDVTLATLAPRYTEALDPATGAGAEGTYFPDLAHVLVLLGILLALSAAITLSLRPTGREAPAPA